MYLLPDHRRLLPLAAAVVLLTTIPAWPQSNPQDSSDRNLQQRAAWEREFHARLEDGSGPPPPSTSGFSATKDFFLLPFGGERPLLPKLQDIPGPDARTSAGKSVVSSEVQLQDSQQRRQLELQTQTQGQAQVPGVPDPGRQQALQIQQLGFDREQRAQELQSNILRDSARAIGTKP